MLSLPANVRIFLASEPVDLRKGFDGLAALVRSQFGQNVFDGHLFAFLGRRRDRVKVLFWDRGGYALFYKRLERGRFRLPQVTAAQTSVRLEATQLRLLLDGADWERVHLPPPWQPPPARPAAGAAIGDPPVEFKEIH